MDAPTGACAKIREPLLLATQRCARLCSYRDVTQSRRSRSFSHVLPHDQEEREGGIGYKRTSSPIDSTPGRILSPPTKFHFHFIFSLSTTPLSLEFSATVEFSWEDRVSRLVLIG